MNAVTSLLFALNISPADHVIGHGLLFTQNSFPSNTCFSWLFLVRGLGEWVSSVFTHCGRKHRSKKECPSWNTSYVLCLGNNNHHTLPFALRS